MTIAPPTRRIIARLAALACVMGAYARCPAVSLAVGEADPSHEAYGPIDDSRSRPDTDIGPPPVIAANRSAGPDTASSAVPIPVALVSTATFDPVPAFVDPPAAVRAEPVVIEPAANVLIERRPIALPSSAGGASSPASEGTSVLRSASSPAAELGIGRTAAALAGVVALALVLAAAVRAAARRRGGLMLALGPAGRAPSGVVHVLARYPIQRGQLLVLLKVGPRVLLACQSRFTRFTGGGMTTLAEFTDPDQVADLVRLTEDAAGTSSEARFRSLLNQATSAGPGEANPEPERDVARRRRVESPAGDMAEFSPDAESILSRAEVVRPARRSSGVSRPATPAPVRASGFAEAGHPDGAEQLRHRLARLRSGADRGTA
ncbi:MAG: flagellar biosynthetic protein FliO [Phycisphaeraceae bacterium]|nr:flagellar biosynthetic protein FliO [Phycisphaerae bacterium]MBX3392902.1 flagellar biosynthetic protein FliO [Phycisphaeraceae bacterium]